ncbi:MAG: hypothetical protein LCH30_06000 [Proteobacteria bacterium]|nr:hypothetical protein [Pseudomonadota bacterium]
MSFWQKTKSFFSKVGQYYKDHPFKAAGLTILAAAGVAGVITASLVSFGAAPVLATALGTIIVTSSPAITAASIGLVSGLTAAASTFVLVKDANNPLSQVKRDAPGKKAEKLAGLNDADSIEELEDIRKKIAKQVKKAEKNLSEARINKEKNKDLMVETTYADLVNNAELDLEKAKFALNKIQTKINVSNDPLAYAANLSVNINFALEQLEKTINAAGTPKEVEEAILKANLKIAKIEKEIVGIITLPNEDKVRIKNDIIEAKTKVVLLADIINNPHKLINNSVNFLDKTSKEIQDNIAHKTVNISSANEVIKMAEALVKRAEALIKHYKDNPSAVNLLTKKLNEAKENVQKAKATKAVLSSNKTTINSIEEQIASWNNENAKKTTHSQFKEWATPSIAKLINLRDAIASLPEGIRERFNDQYQVVKGSFYERLNSTLHSFADIINSNYKKAESIPAYIEKKKADLDDGAKDKEIDKIKKFATEAQKAYSEMATFFNSIKNKISVAEETRLQKMIDEMQLKAVGINQIKINAENIDIYQASTTAVETRTEASDNSTLGMKEEAPIDIAAELKTIDEKLEDIAQAKSTTDNELESLRQQQNKVQQKQIDLAECLQRLREIKANINKLPEADQSKWKRTLDTVNKELQHTLKTDDISEIKNRLTGLRAELKEEVQFAELSEISRNFDAAMERISFKAAKPASNHSIPRELEGIVGSLLDDLGIPAKAPEKAQTSMEKTRAMRASMVEKHPPQDIPAAETKSEAGFRVK